MPPFSPAEQTVTFFMTDIEGSTRQWDAHPQPMREATARHDALGEEIIHRAGGSLIKSRGEGDALFAVFARPDEAVRAAVLLSRAVSGEKWPAPISLRVRIALHTGEAGLRGGDYYGPPVNRCARLRSLARGGQILLSATTARHAKAALSPLNVALEDRGEIALKDLREPERVWEIVGEGFSPLPAFPPLREVPAAWKPLEAEAQDRFIGRADERARLAALLTENSHARLITLTGPGGTGKTRLARQAAGDAGQPYLFADFSALAAESGPDALWQTVRGAANLSADGEAKSVVLHFCAQGSPLVILDNCEHVLSAACQVTRAVEEACPNARLLATSRAPLGLGSEILFPVAPLPLPPEKPRRRVRAEEIAGYDSVQLFVARARAAARPGGGTFALTDANAASVAEICRGVDGIPLALELAAARAAVLSPAQIAARLADSLRLLSKGKPAPGEVVSERQSTLRAAMEWSFDLLAPDERELFCRLSVFAGGWTTEAAEAVCAGEGLDTWAVLDALTGLIAKSLIVLNPATSRHRLLEITRQYALEKRAERGGNEALSRRHRDYFRDFAETREPLLSEGGDSARALGEMDAERANFRAALADAQRDASPEDGLRLGAALARFWQIRGYAGEGRQALAVALAHENTGPFPALCARALNGAGMLALTQGDFDAAALLFDECLEKQKSLGDTRAIADVLNNRGSVAWMQGDWDKAETDYNDALPTLRALGDRVGIAVTLSNLGAIAGERGDYARAESLLCESLALDRTRGDDLGVAATLALLADVALRRDDWDEAARLARESLDLRNVLGDRAGLAECYETLFHAHALNPDGNKPDATRYAEQASTLRAELSITVPPNLADLHTRAVSALAKRGNS